jgi:hypothetical protein
MVLLVIEFLGVEWIGDETPVLEQIGPLFVAGAAAFAAWLAAHTANGRQKNQLNHDSDRQREQLEHDTARQREQLHHDQEMRDREHLRNILETILKSLSRMIVDVVDVSASLVKLEKATTGMREASADEQKEAMERELKALNEVIEKMEGSGSAISATILDGVRLRLFLPPSDPIVRSYLKLSEALRKWHSILSLDRVDGELQLRDEAQLGESKDARKKCDQLLEEFQNVCQSHFAASG